MNYANNDLVFVTIRKNGYWKDSLKGVVIEDGGDKVKVRTKNGNRWYKKSNLSRRIK